MSIAHFALAKTALAVELRSMRHRLISLSLKSDTAEAVEQREIRCPTELWMAIFLLFINI